MYSVIVVLVSLLVVAINAELPRIGLRIPELEPRVVGGKNAVPGQFPYQVSLQWGMPPVLPYRHFCGGSILNEKWILTAGHCILAVPQFGSFVVKAGKFNISSTDRGEQEVSVNRTFIHEKYTGGVAPYDIALILLSKPLTFNENVSNVLLPKADMVQTENSILSGWGSISNTSRPLMPKVLQYVHLPLINLSTCKLAIEGIAGPSPLHNTNICTGPLSGGYAACSGDSGGPLVIKENNQTEIIGIVSWGIIPCGTLGAPSVYTKTSAFVDWITKTMDNNTVNNFNFFVK